MLGRLLFVFLLFTVFVQPVFAQSSTQLNARICVLELDTNLPLAEASVEGNAEGGDLATGVTGSDGCVSLSIALPVSIEDDDPLPEDFSIGEPYPNPVTGRAIIPVRANRPSTIQLELFDIQGRRVTAPRSFPVQVGMNSIPVDLTASPAGLYLYRLSDQRNIYTGKLVNAGHIQSSTLSPQAAERGLSTPQDVLLHIQAIELKVEKDEYVTSVTTVDVNDGQTVEIHLTPTSSENMNEVPVIAAQDDLIMAEGDTVIVVISATDADADPLAWSFIISNTTGDEVPSRLYAFQDQGDGSAKIDFNTTTGDAGSYVVETFVTDGKVSVSDSFKVDISVPVDTSGGMIPINDLGTGTYQGFQGGLYPDGLNVPPATHHTMGISYGNAVEPLNTSGQPDPNGKYVLMSIGMSNTTQEFCSQDAHPPCDSWTFMGQAAADAAVNTSSLVIINGALGGRPADDWVSANGAEYNRIKSDRLESEGLSEAQVQIVWVKVANPRPSPALPDPTADAFRLKQQMGDIARALKTRYANLKQVFFSSRIYAGYAEGVSRLNPEPFAYESAFGVKWVVEAQIDQMDGQGIDDQAGDLAYPNSTGWMGWGAYMWANGATPRSDGLVWLPEDFADDFTHPGTPGEEKVGKALLDFFKSSPYTQCWFVNGGVCE